MNGNTPYVGAGASGSESATDLSADQRRALRRSISSIAARTREFLPDEYAVGSELRRGSNGPQVTVAVRPPVGNPVSAGFEPEFDGADDDALIPVDECDEVARGLAASAALQVKHALADDDVDVPAR